MRKKKEGNTNVSALLAGVDQENLLKDKRHAEELISRLASFPELNPNPVIEVDSAGKVLYANKASENFLEQLGLDREDLRPFLPADINDIIGRLKEKSESSLNLELTIKDRVFLETIHIVPQFDAVRLYVRDITERKKAEEALRQSETSFRLMAETSADIIFQMTIEGRMTYCSQAVRSFGYDPGQVVGKSFSRFIHQDDLPKAEDALQRLNSGERVNLFEISLLRADMSPVSCEINATPVRENGHVVGIQGIARDISERKRAEKALLRSEELFRTLTENSPDSIALHDGSLRHVYVNPTVARIIGKPQDAFVGKTVSEMGMPAEAASAINAMLHSVLETGCTQSGNFTFPSNDGPRFYSWRMVPIKGVDGTDQSIMAIASDITDQKKAEEALVRAKDELELRVKERTRELFEKSRILESFFKHTQTCLVFLDRDFNFIRVNEAYAKACSRQVEDFEGRNHFTDYPAEELKAKFRQVVDTKQPYTVSKRPLTFPEHPEWGTSYWDLSVAPVLDPEGEVDFLFLSLIDVTERKRAEDQLMINNELLELFAQKYTLGEYLDAVCELILKWCGCRQVGLRIVDEHRMVPFLASIGYDPDFLKKEGTLSLVDDQCICTRLISGKPEPTDLACMTPGGSFIACSAPSFIGSLSEQQMSRYCDVCMQAGFRSLAVVPIKYQDQGLGVIHMADEREGIITLKNLEFIEQLAVIAGEAIYRFSAEEQLRKSQEELRNWGKHLREVIENERTSIAREIHDELGQIITALRLDLAWIRNNYKDNSVLFNKSKSMLALVDATIQTINNIISELRPSILDILGLFAAIEWQAAELTKMSGITCDLILPPEDVQLSADISTNIFRIIQELFTNIVRYSKATSVSAQIEITGDRLLLKVIDNGIGISPLDISSPASFGIIGIRERVYAMKGDIHIKGTPGMGTSVMITVPIHAKQDVPPE